MSLKVNKSESERFSSETLKVRRDRRTVGAGVDLLGSVMMI